MLFQHSKEKKGFYRAYEKLQHDNTGIIREEQSYQNGNMEVHPGRRRRDNA